ncbi:MAG: hypothetical protein JXR88_08960 [Clostridia bacterium]|nr:hypothetical protein [Clostridia bacterium]
MRNNYFKREHRGGLLTESNHIKCGLYSLKAIQYVFERCHYEPHEFLMEHVEVLNKWVKREATTGEAMIASREVHQVAKTLNGFEKDIYRAVGHGIGTAHMADHLLGVPLYGLKALKIKDSIEEDIDWFFLVLKTLMNHLKRF